MTWANGAWWEVRLQVKRVEPIPAGVRRGSLSVISWLRVSSSAIKLAEAAPCHTLSKSSDGNG